MEKWVSGKLIFIPSPITAIKIWTEYRWSNKSLRKGSGDWTEAQLGTQQQNASILLICALPRGCAPRLCTAHPAPSLCVSRLLCVSAFFLLLTTGLCGRGDDWWPARSLYNCELIIFRSHGYAGRLTCCCSSLGSQRQEIPEESKTCHIYGRVVKGDFSINPEPPHALHSGACTPYTRAYYTHTWQWEQM